MAKKIGVITLLVILALGILYYSNVALIKNENRKVQEELQAKINQLQKDRQELESRVAQINDAVNKEAADTGTIKLLDIQIQSSEMYNEGNLKGAIYGKFNVVSRIKNINSADLRNITVTSLFLKNVFNQKNVTVDSKTQKIDKLYPGEEKEVVFENFKVDHPEISQEIIVSVFHESISDINEVSNIQKINIRAAFPPNAKD